jgi:hypothetical protein
MSEIERLFAFYIRRFNIDLRRRAMRSDSFMTICPGTVLLSVSDRLEGPAATEAAGLQIARLVLGHGFFRSGLTDARLDRREWKAAMRWLARRLITDHLMSEAQRLGLDAWEVAELAGVTERIVYFWDSGTERLAPQGGNVIMFPAREAWMETQAEAPFF